jgi:hypothetical protein
VIGIMTVMAVLSLAPAALAGAAVVRNSGWKSLKNAIPANALAEGTYQGKGLRTGDEYALHLLGYLDRDDSFIAVAEDKSHPHVALGFLQRTATGDYLWYVMRLSDRQGSEMANPLLSSPIVSLSFTFDGGGAVSTIMAAGLSDGGSENIEFSSARRLELNPSLSSGRWVMGQSQIGLTPSRLAGAQSSTGPVTLWDARVSNNDKSGGEVASGAYLVREEYPGVFTFNATRMNGYVAEVDSGISYVAVSFVDPGFFSDTTKLVMFKIADHGYLEAVGGQFELHKE